MKRSLYFWLHQRVRKEYTGDSDGISFEETNSFFHFLKHIHDIDVAFDFYHAVGADIDKNTMKQVSTQLNFLSFSSRV